MKFIAAWSGKGGAGKTITALSLAHTLALSGQRTLIVDADPQGQCATGLGMQREGEMYRWLVKGCITPASTLRSNLSIIRGNEHTELIDRHFGNLAENEIAVNGEGVGSRSSVAIDMLTERLGELLDMPLDYVVFDCPPRRSLLSEAIIATSDDAIVPTSMDAEEIDGANIAVNAIVKINPDARIVISPNRVRFNPNHDTVDTQGMAAIATLWAHLPQVSLAPHIPPSEGVRKGRACGKTIWEVPVRWAENIKIVRPRYEALANMVMSGT